MRAGHGATLLIHEATFEDALHAHAVTKRHTTTVEALDVGLSGPVVVGGWMGGGV